MWHLVQRRCGWQCDIVGRRNDIGRLSSDNIIHEKSGHNIPQLWIVVRNILIRYDGNVEFR